MKAFISYSLLDSDEYIITKLAGKLEDQGFYPDTGPHRPSEMLVDETLYKIKSAHLFIGFLIYTRAKASISNQRVIKEWEFALSRKIPSILLVEKSMMASIPFYPNANVVSFDKKNPEKAIESVKKAIEEARNPARVDVNNTAAWIFGGNALIALITFLANANQKKKALAA